MADDIKLRQRTLYEDDFYAWTQAQAAALRARRGGEHVLDYDNLAEEIEDVGNEQRFACESDLERIVEHLLKIQLVRSPQTIPHWKGEIDQFRSHMEKRMTRSIRNHVEPGAAGAHTKAVKRMIRLGMIDQKDPLIAVTRAFTWAEITDPDFFTEPLYPLD